MRVTNHLIIGMILQVGEYPPAYGRDKIHIAGEWWYKFKVLFPFPLDSVDGKNPASVDMANISLNLQGSFIPGGCLGFQPSTVSLVNA